jgi:ATP-binding cassette subfamily F protein uup
MLHQRGEAAPERAEVRRAKADKPVEKRVRAAGAPKMKFADAHDLRVLPGKIAVAELEMAKLGIELADPVLFSKNPKRFAELSEKLASLQSQKDADEERWLALEMEREALESGVELAKD